MRMAAYRNLSHFRETRCQDLEEQGRGMEEEAALWITCFT